jgi:hypothetical protein
MRKEIFDTVSELCVSDEEESALFGINLNDIITTAGLEVPAKIALLVRVLLSLCVCCVCHVKRRETQG